MSTERNEEICRRYVGGATLQECGEQFKLSHERIRQILRKAGVFKQHRQTERSDRDEYIGVNVRPETKDELRAEADERGVSVSRHVSDVLDAHVREAPDAAASEGE
jgi:hypothetical protein